MDTVIINLVNAALLIMLWSVYYKENPFSHFVESLLIGLAMGYLIFVTIDTLGSIWIAPMRAGNWLLVIPAILGLMLYAMFSRKHAYLSRITIAAIVGTGMGFATARTVPVMILGQIKGLGTSLVSAAPLDVFNWAVILVTSISTLTYFTFTREHTGSLGLITRLGRWSIMIGFGTIFGATIWGNHVFVIERCAFISEAPMAYLIPIAFAVILWDVLRRRKQTAITG